MKSKSGLLKFPEITEEKLTYDFSVLGLSGKQVAEKYKCSTTTIDNYLRRFNTTRDPSSRWLSPYLRQLFRDRSKLTTRQISILIGSGLGDGSFSGAKRNKNASYTIGQCFRRKAYLEWQREELHPFVPKPITLVTAGDIKSVYLITVAHPEFTKLQKVFYPNGKKIVPPDIGRYLDELALAVWYMDDGYTSKGRSMFCTHGFTGDDCKLLLKTVYSNLSLEGRIETSNKKSVLIFSKGNHYKLHSIIDPFLHSCFDYKKIPEGQVYEVKRLVGESNPSAKFAERDIKEIRRLAAEGMTFTSIGKLYDSSEGSISWIVNRRSWKHVI